MAATGFGMCAKQISAMRMWVVAEIIIIMVILSVPWDQKWSVFVGNQCLSRSWAGVGLAGFWRENGGGSVWLGRGNPSKSAFFKFEVFGNYLHGLAYFLSCCAQSISTHMLPFELNICSHLFDAFPPLFSLHWGSSCVYTTDAYTNNDPHSVKILCSKKLFAWGF